MKDPMADSTENQDSVIQNKSSNSSVIPMAEDELREFLDGAIQDFISDFTSGYEKAKSLGQNVEYHTFDTIVGLLDDLEKIANIYTTNKIIYAFEFALRRSKQQDEPDLEEVVKEELAELRKTL